MDDLEIITCIGVYEWDRWLAKHGATRPSVWLKIAKKGSGVVAMGAEEAGEVAICHGWIDGQRRSLDASHFLQRFSPRRPGSAWSLVNVARVEALETAGRMRPSGRAQVAAAKADGRWAAAYAPQRTAAVPEDLTAALATNSGRARPSIRSAGAIGPRCSCRCSRHAHHRRGPRLSAGHWRRWKPRTPSRRHRPHGRSVAALARSTRSGRSSSPGHRPTGSATRNTR